MLLFALHLLGNVQDALVVYVPFPLSVFVLCFEPLVVLLALFALFVREQHALFALVVHAPEMLPGLFVVVLAPDVLFPRALVAGVLAPWSLALFAVSALLVHLWMMVYQLHHAAGILCDALTTVDRRNNVRTRKCMYIVLNELVIFLYENIFYFRVDSYGIY